MREQHAFDAADDLVMVDETPLARIDAVLTIVAQYHVLVFRNPEWPPIVVRREIAANTLARQVVHLPSHGDGRSPNGERVCHDVALLKAYSVDEHSTLSHFHRLTSECNDPLYDMSLATFVEEPYKNQIVPPKQCVVPAL